jgi:TetR/AcrR family transcriptional regulator, fatty acid metabolism regulator protein
LNLTFDLFIYYIEYTFIKRIQCMRRREGNKEKAILEAAVKIFAQRGYHRAKISSIAEQAGIATGSVYLYFKNKETILLTIFDRLWIDLTVSLQNIVKQANIDPSMKLDLVIERFFDNFITHPSLATVFVNEQHHLIKGRRGNIAKHYNDFFDLAEEIIREGVQKKVFNPDIDIKLYRHFIIGGLRSTLLLWSQQSQSLPLEHVRQNMKFFIKHGLL